MTLSKKIRVLCIRTNITLSELARRTDNSPQNFSGKLKRESFSQRELEQIAVATNSRFEQFFILPNGEKI